MPSDRSYGSRWARLIPVAFVTYSLAYVDRANYSIGSAAGLAKDLHITGNADALLGALFFLGYFIFQIPGAWYAERRSAKRLIFWSLLLWGVLASLIGVISNLYALYLVRFLLGVAESVVLPGMLIFLSHWFTKAERSRANTFLILGNPVTVLWMSIVSGYLVHAVGWRGMFIAEGLPAVVWGFVWLLVAQDDPAQARWLAPEEREALKARLAEEQRALRPVRNYREAFRSPPVILLALQYLCWSVGVYGFVIWLPSMLKAGGSIGIVEVGWLSAAPYLLATLLMIAASQLSDARGRRRPFVWPFLVVGALAFLGSYLLGRSSFWPGYVLLVIAGGAMYAPYGPFFAWIAESLPRNVAGGAIALINSCGALGSFVGSYAVGWLNAATGGPSLSFLAMAAALLLSGLLTLAVREREEPRPHPLVSGA
ncbi:MAG: MFS transporter [Acetobacteraceae bacterium]|nr:MFS transporter [Acetobacteraceae bacterium]